MRTANRPATHGDHHTISGPLQPPGRVGEEHPRQEQRLPAQEGEGDECDVWVGGVLEVADEPREAGRDEQPPAAVAGPVPPDE